MPLFCARHRGRSFYTLRAWPIIGAQLRFVGLMRSEFKSSQRPHELPWIHPREPGLREVQRRAHTHQRATGAETPGALPPTLSAGAGAVETRSRHSSYPEGTEDEGMEGEEPGPFRGRSSSAPPNLWAARRYGRELRRMSDEFQVSFQALPRPKSAGTATQMRQSPSWTRAIQSWWDRNLGRGGSAPSQ